MESIPRSDRSTAKLEHTDIRYVHIHTDVQSGLYKSLNLLRRSIENCGKGGPDSEWAHIRFYTNA